MKALSLFLLLPSLLLGMEYDYLRLPKKAVSPEWITAAGFIEDHRRDDTYLLGYLPKNTRLSAELQDQVLTLDAWDWAQNFYDLKTLQKRGTEAKGEQSYEEFHTYVTLTDELKQLAKNYPMLVTLESAGQTVEKREMWLVRLTNKANALPSKPKLLFISSMHGDEVTGKEMMVYLIRTLLKSHGTDSRLTALLDNNELFIMPSMNPDGTERKQRFNANGVDLNRDFPLLEESPTDPNRAIEVRNIQALHERHHFLTALNFHGGELCVNIPWDSKKNSGGTLFGDDKLMSLLARTYSDLNLPMKANHFGNFVHGVTYGYEWYPVYGGMQDWASHFYQSTHATIEISSIKWPAASALPRFWKDNQESLIQYLEKSTKGYHLKVMNEAGKLLPVEVRIGSAQRSMSFNGYVHRPSSLAKERVTLRSAGYQAMELELSAQTYNGTFLEITLASE